MKYPIPEKIPLRKREWLDRELTKAPIWCSVDLRDGNQALPMPMNPEKKLEYFKLLCAIGFKEIEVSFPSASQDDFDFVRNLIEKKEIPSDVRISVLTQAREPLIRRTVESLVGVEKAILHLYVATSDLHEQIVFGKTHEETMKMAVEGTKLIAYFIEKYPYMDETPVSVHSHNDQGCAVASSEFTIMAGAERVEGTLFGHGERTGNVDLCTLALNLASRNIPTGLDFSDLPHIVKVVENATGIDVHERHPYAGQLAFTAFSGSHQDAIRKGIDRLAQAQELFHVQWKVPYLHIDPADVGRKYEKLIRINSQSGKGGVAYVLEHDFEIYPPKGMHPEIGASVQKYADAKGDELDAAELLKVFNDTFVNVKGPFELLKFSRISKGDEHDESKEGALVEVSLNLKFDGQAKEIRGIGNGPISATVHAIRNEAKLYDFILEDFSEKTLGTNADAKAIAFVGVRRKSDNRLFYGVGEHQNIDLAAIFALFSALNRAILNERG